MKKGSKGEVVFTAKGGAWFMIVVCAIVLVSVGWIIVGAITGCVEIIGVEVLFWEVLFFAMEVFFQKMVGYTPAKIRASLTRFLKERFH